MLSLNETKALTTNTLAEGDNVWAQPQTWCLSLIHQGSTDGQRVGDKVIMKSLQVVGRIYFNWAESAWRSTFANTCRVRIVIFIWKDDTEPDIIADVIDMSTGYTPADACNFFYDADKKPKRKVLWDKTYDVCNNMIGTCASDGSTVAQTWWAACGPDSAFNVKAYIPLTKLPLAQRTISFASGTTDAINHVYMFIVADANSREIPIPAQTGPNFRGMTRLSYTDA